MPLPPRARRPPAGRPLPPRAAAVVVVPQERRPRAAPAAELRRHPDQAAAVSRAAARRDRLRQMRGALRRRGRAARDRRRASSGASSRSARRQRSWVCARRARRGETPAAALPEGGGLNDVIRKNSVCGEFELRQLSLTQITVCSYVFSRRVYGESLKKDSLKIMSMRERQRSTVSQRFIIVNS